MTHVRSNSLHRSIVVRFGLIAALSLFAACSSHGSGHSGQPVHWGYEHEDGPPHWCDLDPANSECCEGKEQSPIDIQTAKVVSAHPAKLELVYPQSTFSVVNNGHTVQANLQVDKAKCGLSLGGVSYELKQFHMHTPSEHTLNGKHSPLEIHLVHQSADGNLAVVGLMVEPGEANGELEKVWRLAPEQKGEGGIAVGVNLGNVLPEAHSNYRYPGSLTTPPCSEHVQWIVMQTPITMSEEQIMKLEAMFTGPEFPEGNARPVQPVGARRVEIDSGS
jgi:carbonic anhydrase